MSFEADGYAAIVPVGPASIEMDRVTDLLDALRYFEPGMSVCVLLDNGPDDRLLERRFRVPSGCRIVSLVNPHRGIGKPLLGALCTGILEALRAIAALCLPKYVVRLDSDALVIGKFDDRVRDLIERHPEAGMIGARGRTCRRDWPDYGFEASVESKLIRSVKLLPCDGAGPMGIPGVGVFSPEAIEAFERIRSHIVRAMANGYSTLEYCQGGAYILTAEFLRRMHCMGYLESAPDWARIPVAEDVMMGMYTRAVDLKVMDHSQECELFGTHFRGLPYHPPELVTRGYSLIHSLRNNAQYSEEEVRAYFRNRRVGLLPSDRGSERPLCV